MHEWAESLLPYERDIFLWLNGHHTPFWDTFMYLYSGKRIWLPLVLVALFCNVYKVKWRETVLLIVAAILIGVICDQLASSVIRPFFERFRPTHHPDYQLVVHIVNNYRGGNFGFVSSHAANGFGAATLASLLFRYRYFTITIFGWALLTCYSRIYLGVHFVTDVLGGMLLGISTSFLVYYLYLLARHYWLKVPKEELTKPILDVSKAKLQMATIGLIVIGIIIYSALNPTIG